MKASFRRTEIFNPASTLSILVHSGPRRIDTNGESVGSNMTNVADCRRESDIRFLDPHETARRISLAKIKLLIKILQPFREALTE